MLLTVESRSATEVAVGLLDRAVRDYDRSLQTPWAHELLAEAYCKLGDLRLAEQHLRECLETADERRNGTTGAAELTLVEVLLDQDHASEACDTLDRVDASRLVWNSQRFRYSVARARCEQSRGVDPVTWATEALRLSQIVDPQLARHPDIGLVKADLETLDEMRRLAQLPSKRG